MTRQELFELQLYYEVEPFGDRRADLRGGMLLSLLHNGFLKRNQDPVAKPEDFVMFDAELQQAREAKREGARAMLRRATAAIRRHMQGVNGGSR